MAKAAKKVQGDDVANVGEAGFPSETTIAGVSFALSADQVLAHREYEDRVVVVTIDGQKLVGLKTEQ